MLTGDYHTHTTYSRMGHGKGSVEDNVRAAAALGLKEIGLTDHGLRHLTFGMTRKALPRFLADVRAAREKFPEVRVYAGLECNFLPSGETDLTEDAAELLDITVCGYHKLVRGAMSALLANTFSKNSARTLARNTDMYVRSLERYDIDIISHPQHDCRIDLRAVGEVAAAKGTYIELNGKHRDMTSDELVMLADLGCEFVMDSDAHSPARVGDVALQVAAMEEAGLPMTLVANWDRLPVFRSGGAHGNAERTG